MTVATNCVGLVALKGPVVHADPAARTRAVARASAHSTGCKASVFAKSIDNRRTGLLGKLKNSSLNSGIEVKRAMESREQCPSFSKSAPGEVRASAEVIDGKAIAKAVRTEVAEQVSKMLAQTGHVPGLAVVLVGSRKDSETYVRSKKSACEEAGILSLGADLPEDVSQDKLLQVIRDFNADDRVHGILVQLPLPKHIDEEKVLQEISVEKDVDGFHPINIGRLAMRGRDPLFVPCTPKGCLELLLRSGVEIKGKRAVVIGRSNIVGIPAAFLLQKKDATVTVVHSRTVGAADIVRQADIVVAAVGVAEMVKGDWLKPGCAVIDVGINAVDDASKKTGYRLVGDVAYAEAVTVAGKITPVPGGVGP
eukprot:jgi/Mesvir1/3575/Mv12038-RA.1